MTGHPSGAVTIPSRSMVVPKDDTDLIVFIYWHDDQWCRTLGCHPAAPATGWGSDQGALR